MIAKHVAMKTLKKSSFEHLVHYITHEQNKHERVCYTSATNCFAHDIDAALLEIMAVQHKNTRATSDKTYHLIISFPAGELPEKPLLDAIEHEFCSRLGFGEHQRISAVHSDTDNMHMHLAINKIHPKRLTLHQPYYDYHCLSQVCAELEAQHHLQPTNHRAQKTVAESKALAMEHIAGVESLLGWIKRECRDALKQATTWHAFNQVLDAHGLTLKERGNGYVFEDQDGLMVKASSVDRAFAKAKLAQRFSEQPAPITEKPSDHPKQHTPQHTYQAQPLQFQVDTTALYQRYQATRLSQQERLAKDLAAIKSQQERLIAALKRDMKLARDLSTLAGATPSEQKILRTLAQQRFDHALKAIKAQCQRDRAATLRKNKPESWLNWLQHEALEGNQDALDALRSRKVAQGLHGNTVSGRKTNVAAPLKLADVEIDHITKHGTIIYRSDAVAIRDDGNKLSISRQSTDEGLILALTIAQQRYGHHITVNGSESFKARVVQASIAGQLAITFTDAALENQRQTLLKQQSGHKTSSINRYTV